MVGFLPPPEKFRVWASGPQMATRMLDILEERGVLDEQMLGTISEEFGTTRQLPEQVDEPA